MTDNRLAAAGDRLDRLQREKKYRDKEQNCLKMAEGSLSPDEKARWLDLAKSWGDLADEFAGGEMPESLRAFSPPDRDPNKPVGVVECPGCKIPMSVIGVKPVHTSDLDTILHRCQKCGTETKRESRRSS